MKNTLSFSLQVTDHSQMVRYPRLIHMYGLITTRTGLRLPLQSSFFHNSKAVVKCTSTISPGFWGSSSSASSSSVNRGGSITLHGPGGGRKESLAQATRHHSVIDSREDTFIGELIYCCTLIGNTDTWPASSPLSFLVTVHSAASSIVSSSLCRSLIYSLVFLLISCRWTV